MALQNQPPQATSFIGREREILQVQEYLAGTRLLTLTGAGGTGKTRLSLEAAGQLTETYPDGIWFVPLAALSDPGLVPQAVARAVGVQEGGSRPVSQSLPEYLADKHLLLIWDNCEHVIEACAALADTLLASCPHVRILATSREPLAVAWEQIWAVPPLSPDDEGVQLFITRARAANPAFSPTPAVQEICRRLDGLPLAIELAAARSRALSPEQIAERLGDSLHLLTSQSRTSPPRQQTMRGAIDWSHALLSVAEQQLFRRLAVFAGGFTLEAAGAVAASQDVLDLLSQLVDKSLVVSAPPRYRLLEPLRQYALEQLRAQGEESEARTRHLAHFVAFADQAHQHLWHGDQAGWIRQVDAEFDNLRQALEWSLEHAPLDGLKIAAGLGRYWPIRGHFSEGCRWFHDLLARCPEPTETRATALFYARQVASANPRALLEESYRIFTDMGIKRGTAWCGVELANLLHNQGDSGRVAELLAASRTIFLETGDRLGLAMCAPGTHPGSGAGLLQVHADLEVRVGLQLEAGDKIGAIRSLTDLAWLDHYARAYDKAASRLGDAIALAKEVGDKQGLAAAFMAMGDVAHKTGDYETAGAMYELAHQRFRELGDPVRSADALHFLGRLALDTRQTARARQLLTTVLRFARDLGAAHWVRNITVHLACAHLQDREFEQAARLADEAIAMARQQQLRTPEAWCLRIRSLVAAEQGDYQEALRWQRQSFTLDTAEPGPRAGYALGLCVTGMWLIHAGRAEQGLRLVAAASAIHPLQTALDPFERPYLEPALAAAQGALGEVRYHQVWATGEALSLEQAIDEALGRTEADRTETVLTARETEVARLVAQGLSDRDVAARLVISPRTVDTHLRNIFGKLGVESRTALAAWALKNGI